MKTKQTYKYLLELYNKVETYLNSERPTSDELPDHIVWFCTAIEKILKTKLHRKNPVLIFEAQYLRDENSLIAITQKKEKEIPTVRVEEMLSRFGIIYKSIFTTDELQTLKDIYRIRNSFVHGYKPDEHIVFDSVDVLRKMSTIWEKISQIAIALFGKDSIKKFKPKRKYSESELEEVLEKEVEKMIGSNDTYMQQSWSGVNRYGDSLATSIMSFGETCPRCGMPKLSLSSDATDWKSVTSLSSVSTLYAMSPYNSTSSIYRCANCNLELTEKQYEIAKKIRSDWD